MKIDKDRLTEWLGISGNKCPVCGHRMSVYARDEQNVVPEIRGVPFFECRGCGFEGDAIKLAATVRCSTESEALSDMREDKIADVKSSEAVEWSDRRSVQAAVCEHFDKCVEKLLAAPERCNIRAGLSVSSKRLLPPGTGMHVMLGAPPQFQLLSGQRYTMVPMVLYRYMFNDTVTCIDAQNPKTLEREHRLRVTGDIGVYLGSFAPGKVPRILLATQNPRTAGQLFGAMRAESSLMPPVIGVAGFPLPEKFAQADKIYLLDASDSPLGLTYALKCLVTPTVYGVDDAQQPQVLVVQPKAPASEIRAEHVRKLFLGHHGMPLRAWIREKLLSMADRLEEVANSMLQASLSDGARVEIAEILGENAPKALVDTVILPTTVPDDVFQLGNGRYIKCTPVGIYTAAKSKESGRVESKSLLCNVGVSVTARIVGNDGETAVCTVSHPDPDIPDITVRVPEAHWSNCDMIAGDIRGAYAQLGRTPYVAFYRAGGYGWYDIMQFIGSHCPVQTGIRRLGATSDGVVNLPNAVLTVNSVERQTKAGDIDEDCREMYSALPFFSENLDFESIFSQFLAKKASLRSTGLFAGLIHALFSMTGGLYYKSGARTPPHHMLFVETEPGVWDDTMRDLAYFFSGSEAVPLIDHANSLKFIEKFADLGTLPLVSRIPSSEAFSDVLSRSPVGVIGVADVVTAMSCSGRGQVSFVLPNVENDDGYELSAEDFDILRKSLVGLAAKYAKDSPWRKISCGGTVSTCSPCLSVASSLSEAAPGSVADGLGRSVKSRFPGLGTTGMTAFFNVLHQEYVANMRHDEQADIKLTFVAGEPTDTVISSFNERGQHVFVLDDAVILGRSAVQTINREKIFMFDAEQLSKEMTERGIIDPDSAKKYGIDPKRVWVIPRDMWDTYVVRATGYSEKEK